ncbi:aspartate carbamoyltransferase [Bittarella massiliensis]|uniref:Aspartate carbamoyltransferase n=1 Tax=Bittarella massiliensis (ex Durand et al. 2017) TaxID=1720313 RepID=A0AAQ1MD63_9FIRM|nr:MULTISPECIES: aspartate carbamoyltransferase [Eubacteriales]MZL70637.1 aspartate carbamoyltransferase [Bittarella massiliensis (ex Durand et al. 2017)]MZL81366.1 aspartate carbamoyltransferase [Bittarella massiliensis (ex Durand et al. 2017)]SHG04453.1 aspartate carbamoyltransferase [Bittarella massiliensis (ex Durand et al. 2017)]
MLAGRNLISPSDFSPRELDELFALADDIVKDPAAYAHACDGKLLATLFFEPSTRTRLSFEAAMLRLGGRVFGVQSAAASSTSKGETVADTARMVSSYADAIAMRHFLEGAPRAATLYAGIPVINAGDGGHQHPTQTLTDLYTIRTAKGRLDHLTIGLCGDLKFGRTVHSLIEAMCRYEGVTFYCISPEELSLPNYIIAQMEAAGAAFHQVRTMEECIGRLDVLYMTRVQGERFADRAEYERLRDCYILDAAKMAGAGADTIVLHPLPRVSEIATEVDADPRAWYFKQAQYGMFARMALLCKVLGVTDGHPVTGARNHLEPTRTPAGDHPGHRCQNPKCVACAEPTQPPRFVEEGGRLRCWYCDQLAD